MAQKSDNSLFDAVEKANIAANAPLAVRMRPRTLDEFAGQEEFVGEGKLLRRMLDADRLTSVIFYGPPGTGKTSLAKVIAAHTKANSDIWAVGNFQGPFIAIKIAENTTRDTGKFWYGWIIGMYPDMNTFLFCNRGSFPDKILIIFPNLILSILAAVT